MDSFSAGKFKVAGFFWSGFHNPWWIGDICRLSCILQQVFSPQQQNRINSSVSERFRGAERKSSTLRTILYQYCVIYIYFLDTILDPDCYPSSSRMSNSQHTPKTLIVEMLKVTQHSAVKTPTTHTHTHMHRSEVAKTISIYAWCSQVKAQDIGVFISASSSPGSRCLQRSFFNGKRFHVGIVHIVFFFLQFSKRGCSCGNVPRELPPRVTTEVAKLFWSVFISAFPAIK